MPLDTGNLLGYDPNQFSGLLDPVDIARAKRQALLGTGLGLLGASGRTTQPVNFGPAFAQAAMMGQEQGQQSLQQAMMMRQAQEQRARQQAEAQQQAMLQDALRRGDIGGAAAIDPVRANAFRQATAQEGPRAFTAEDGSVRWAMPGQNLGPVAKPAEAPKSEIKPVYTLDGRPLGNAAIDAGTGAARVGDAVLRPGEYTTEKPDNARASPAALNLQNDLRDRMMKVNAAKAALANVKTALAATKGLVFDTGPVDAALDWTPSNNAFNAAVAQLSPHIRALTKTPGEGSVSDYEQKLQQMALPSQSNYMSTNEAIIKNLEQTVAGLEADYAARLAKTGVDTGSGFGQVGAGGMSDADLKRALGL